MNLGFPFHRCSSALTVGDIHNATHWTEGFGLGLDYYGSDGGVDDGKITIRFRNDEHHNMSYINIRVKYRQKARETSYLCAIDGSFTADSPISFGVKGRNDNDWYRIQHIAVSACSGYWEIPTVWCENVDPALQTEDKYSFWGWSSNEWTNLTQYEYDGNDTSSLVSPSYQVVHGLFGGMDKVQQMFGPLVEHEVVSIELDLWYGVDLDSNNNNNASDSIPDGVYLVVEVDGVSYAIDVPDGAGICDGDWNEVVYDQDLYLCTKRMYSG